METQKIEEIEISTELCRELETLAKAEDLTIDQFINKLAKLALEKQRNKEQI